MVSQKKLPQLSVDNMLLSTPSSSTYTVCVCWGGGGGVCVCGVGGGLGLIYKLWLFVFQLFERV